MSTALFKNWTDEEFVGYWDGKPRKFKPGESIWLPDFLARHFAKHLTNRELLRTDKDGNLVYKNGEKFTSPKHLFEDNSKVPVVFMELLNKAYKREGVEKTEEVQDENDQLNSEIESTNRNRGTSNELVTQTMDDDEEFQEKPTN